MIDKRLESYRRRPRAPVTGANERHGPRKADFAPYAIVFEDRVILRTPYEKELIDALKQIPAQLRGFVKDGRPLERKLREYLESNEDYFASSDELATSVMTLVDCIAASAGLSDAWAVSLATPELFEWAVGSALKSFPTLQLFDVRILGDEEAAPE